MPFFLCNPRFWSNTTFAAIFLSTTLLWVQRNWNSTIYRAEKETLCGFCIHQIHSFPKICQKATEWLIIIIIRWIIKQNYKIRDECVKDRALQLSNKKALPSFLLTYQKTACCLYNLLKNTKPYSDWATARAKSFSLSGLHLWGWAWTLSS
jgi:hypothetical protein